MSGSFPDPCPAQCLVYPDLCPAQCLVCLDPCPAQCLACPDPCPAQCLVCLDLCPAQCLAYPDLCLVCPGLSRVPTDMGMVPVRDSNPSPAHTVPDTASGKAQDMDTAPVPVPRDTEDMGGMEDTVGKGDTEDMGFHHHRRLREDRGD